MLNDTHTATDSGTTDSSRVVTVVALEGRTEAALLALVAGLAGGLEPRLAAAIRDGARERGVDATRLDQFHETAATGVAGTLGGHRVALGNAAFFAGLGLSISHLCDWPERMRQHGQQVLFIAIDGRTVGFLGIAAAV